MVIMKISLTQRYLYILRNKDKMTTGALTTDDEKKIYLYRANTATGSLSATQYLPTDEMIIGVSGVAPNVGATDIEFRVPITNGTVNDDGSTNLSGSTYALDSTDNTSNFKEGGGVSDDTAQNLMSDGYGPELFWGSVDLTTAGTAVDIAKKIGFNLYVKDAATLLKISTVRLFVGSDSGGANSYWEFWDDTVLTVGWNFLTSADVVGDWNTVGTPTGTIKYARVSVIPTGALSGSPIVAGDLIYDLLRQWAPADETKAMISGYPTFDYTGLSVTKAFLLTTSEANGFLIDNLATINSDTISLSGQIALTGGDSKSSTDQWRITFKERLI